MNLRDGLPHSYADELPPPRMPVQRESRGDYWRAFATFAFLIASLYALVIIGAATWAIEAAR